MLLPDDYGMDAVRTLAHVSESLPPSGFSSFWNRWTEEVESIDVDLVPREARDHTDVGATHEFRSLGDVRIGGRLLEAPTPKAMLLRLHGYEAPPYTHDDDANEPLLDRGISVLTLRVRGYPGSMLDMLDANRDGFGWITHGLDVAGRTVEDIMPWVYVRAIADVVLAIRALERFDLPIAIRGESFGGGLATAAAALAPTRIDRLVLGLPTMGDWPFRLRHPPGHVGIGHEIDEALRRSGTRREDIEHRLSLADTCLLAPRVRVPTLCKLAARDDVVPAPTAAAIFNALGSSTSHKWRFVVPYGHFDGGLRNARRHALFERCVTDFLDPDVTPSQGMVTWEAQCTERDA